MAESYFFVFWLTFAAFIGPVFIIALFCSIIKAIKDRKRFYKRKAGEDDAAYNPNSPVDAEIIAGDDRTRKMRLQVVEDEKKRRLFRNSRGSLAIVDQTVSVKKRFQGDSAVDKSQNKCDEEHHERCEVNWDGCVRFDTNSCARANDIQNSTKRPLDKGKNNNRELNSVSAAKKYSDRTMKCNNDKYHSRNSKTPGNFDEKRPNAHYTRDRRRSVSSDNLSKTTPRRGSDTARMFSNCLSERNIHYATTVSSSNEQTVNHSPEFRRPYSRRVRSRRYSDSCSPEVCRRHTGKASDVEMGAMRSQSEDNLVEQSHPSSSNLTTARQGKDNRGFARSIETTIM